MKSLAAGAASGCVVWTLVFCLMSGCLLSVALPIGSYASTTDFAVDVLGPYVCPSGSTAELVTHPSTGTDSSGNPISTTAYEMQCVDASGGIVREPSPDYAFIWLGVLAAAALLLSVLFAFLLAAPAGALMTGLINRLRKSNAR